MDWRLYILLAVPFLFLGLFILIAVPEAYTPLAFVPVLLFWIVYYILVNRKNKKKQ